MRSFVPTAERYGRDIPAWLRLLTCWRLEPGSAEFRWGQVAWRGGFQLGLTYSIYHDTAHVGVYMGWLKLYLKAPVLITFRPGTEDWNASWGFHSFEDAVHLNWRTSSKLLDFPWRWSHVRSSVFDIDGRQVWEISEYGVMADKNGRFHYKDGRHVETHPFVYVLRSGEIQHRTATIWGEEMEWRWRWFRWLPWPRLVKRSISITFSDEVGERTGSWKGGTIGCSWDWRNGETMKAALQRMQHTREFR